MTELSLFVVKYGYLAIFLLVFLQELGVPNPVSNELVLLYGGYLSFLGLMSLPKILLVTVIADFTGTSILYFVFYAFGNYIISHKPKWFPLSEERIETIRERIFKGGRKTIFVGRLIPFLRGYVSVGAGIVQIKPQVFLLTVITSAITWSGGLVVLGWLLAPYWNIVVQKTGTVEHVILIVVLAGIIFMAGRYVTRNFFNAKRKDNQQKSH